MHIKVICSILLQMSNHSWCLFLIKFSNTNVFLWNLRNLWEHLFSQNTSSGCFWIIKWSSSNQKNVKNRLNKTFSISWIFLSRILLLLWKRIDFKIYLYSLNKSIFTKFPNFLINFLFWSDFSFKENEKWCCKNWIC